MNMVKRGQISCASIYLLAAVTIITEIGTPITIDIISGIIQITAIIY
jgi:hypothetical protein